MRFPLPQNYQMTSQWYMSAGDFCAIIEQALYSLCNLYVCMYE